MAVRDILAWNVKMLDIDNAPIAVGGLATEFELPTLEREFDTEKRAGESGVISRPKFWNELEASFTLMSYSEEFHSALLKNVAKTVTMQLSASAADANGSSVVYTASMRGFYSEFPMGSFSDTDFEIEITLKVNYLSVQFGTQTFVYDPANYIYSVNGANVLANIKTDLGL